MYMTKETNETIILENATHRLKITEKKLDKIKDKGDLAMLLTHVQKNIKQIVENSSGQFWQESVNEMYEELRKMIVGD